MEPAGVEVPILWRGRRARAFVPTRLAERDLTLDAETVAGAARAQAAVEHGAETMPEDFAALARLLLRAEGVASSFIEGVTAPVVDIVLAEADDGGSRRPRRGSPPTSPRSRRRSRRRTPGRSTVESLCRWHRTLMTGSPTPAQHVGAVRTEQGWIGGTSPLDAHLVTPPPDEVPALLDDLVALRQPRRRRSGEPGGDRARPVRDHPSLRRRQRARSGASSSRGYSSADCRS